MERIVRTTSFFTKGDGSIIEIEKLSKVTNDEVERIKENSYTEEEYFDLIHYDLLREVRDIYDVFPETLVDYDGEKDVVKLDESCGSGLILPDFTTIHLIDDSEAFYEYSCDKDLKYLHLLTLKYILKSSHMTEELKNEIYLIKESLRLKIIEEALS